MEQINTPSAPQSSLHDDTDARLPAAAFLSYKNRADGWSAGRQAACLAHLADNGIIADAVRSVGMSVGGSYSLRRQARGYPFNLGWEAALIIMRRIVTDNLMTAAIRGEVAEWVREEGKTTYIRQNAKLSLALLDRVNPATALPDVMEVATRFDWFLELIDQGASAEQLWECFFDDALPRSDPQTRDRVRAALLLSEDSAGFEKEDDADEDEKDAPIEYKSMEGAPSPPCPSLRFPAWPDDDRTDPLQNRLQNPDRPAMGAIPGGGHFPRRACGSGGWLYPPLRRRPAAGHAGQAFWRAMGAGDCRGRPGGAG